MRKTISFLSIFMLTGCYMFDSPTPLPSGYTYHDTEYRSRPGPEEKSLGYEYSEEKNAQILTELQAVANDLIDKVEAEFNIHTDTVYLAPVGTGADAFTLSMDYVLREALKNRGYILSSSAKSSLGLRFNVVDPYKDITLHHRLNADIKPDSPPVKLHRPLRLSLMLFDTQGTIGNIQGEYDAPVYGFEDDKLGLKLYDYVLGKGASAKR